MELEMVVWSDNDNIREVADIIHNEGYRTAEIRKEDLGAYENRCNWSWCKANLIDSCCVDTAMGRTVDIDEVAEMPMFRYVVYIIVGHDDDDNKEQKQEEMEQEQEEEQGENTMEDKKVNVVMNIGMTTKDGIKMQADSAIDRIGKETDCTITQTVGFYHGQRENSLKIEIYSIEIDRAVAMASYFAHLFVQECVSVTVGNTTVFVTDDYTEDDFLKWCDTLEK